MPITTVPPASLPENLTDCTVRVPTRADVDAVHALGMAVDRSFVGAPVLTRGMVANLLESESGRLDSAHLIVERSGRPIVWSWLQQAHPDHLAGEVQVHPDVEAAPADELVTWSLDWFEHVARANFVDPSLERIQLGNYCYEQHAERAEQLRRAGYEQSRAFIRMVRRFDADTVFPEPAGDVVVRPAVIDLADPAGSEAALVHELITTAFVDHYNYTPSSFDVWFKRRSDDAGFDPALWFVAELDGRPLGAMVANRELEQEQRAGYVHYVGVLREARGRGLAKALLYKAFAVNQEEGLTATKLYVDAESPTGATHLYESAGMVREQVALEWQKWLTRDASV